MSESLIRVLLAILGAMFALPACAQKSADTIRIGMAGSMATISTYHDSTPASNFLSYGLFDTIIAFDERTNTYQPLIAKSWTRTDDRTLEFEIRDDAKWHDGSRVDVDDVVYTFDWLSNPETHLHLDYQWDWIDHVEKLGRTKLRLIAKKPTSYDLARLAMHIPILPEHKHGQLLGERYYFGRNPIGSGPYKFVSLDHRQATIQRVDTYAYGGAAKPMPKIGRVQVSAGWDYSERETEWRAGKLDMLLDADPKLANELARDASITKMAAYKSLVLSFDTRGHNAALTDARVRKALSLALDRDAIARATDTTGQPARLCWPVQAGCGPAPATPGRDVAAARALLNEYASKVEIVLGARGGQAAEIAELVARDWRAVGATVRVEAYAPEVLYMRVRDRALDAVLYPWHGGSMPDVYDTMQMLMAPGFWDVHEDPALQDLALASHAAMDDGARRGIVGRALALVADKTYMTPLAALPTVIVHRSEVAIDARGRWQDAGFNILDLGWK